MTVPRYRVGIMVFLFFAWLFSALFFALDAGDGDVEKTWIIVGFLIGQWFVAWLGIGVLHWYLRRRWRSGRK